MDRNAQADRSTLAAFGGAVLIGGANFVAVRFSNEELQPLFGAALRFAAAGLLLLLVTMVRKLPLPRGRAAIGAAIWGSLGFGLAYGLMYFALVGLSAGTTSVIGAAVPLVTLVLAVAHRQERFTIRGIFGGVLALAGIALISARSIEREIRPVYVASALLAVVAIAESSVVVKGFPRAHPVTTNAVGMTVGALLLAGGSLASGEEWRLPETGRTWIVLLWLVIAGSIGLFALFLFVIKRWAASASVYALTLMPVVAVTLGAVLADEEVTPTLVAGGVLVLTAVYVGALSQRDPAAPPPVPEAAAGHAD